MIKALLCILLASVIWMHAPVMADVVLHGKVKTNVPPPGTSVRETNTDAFRKAYAKLTGLSETQAQAFIENYNGEYTGDLALGGVTYEVRIKGTNKVVSGTTTPAGNFIVTLPDEFGDAMSAGTVEISFTMTGPDHPNIYESGQSYAQSDWVPVHSDNAGTITIDANSGPNGALIAEANNTYYHINKLTGILEDSSPYLSQDVKDAISDIDTRYITLNANESLADIKSLFSSVNVNLAPDASVDVFNGGKFAHTYHEMGHVLLFELVGTDYSYQYVSDIGGNHELGGQLNYEGYATNESFAHWFAGVNLGIPVDVYFLTDSEYINQENLIDRYKETINNMIAKGDPGVDARKMQYYNNLSGPYAEQKTLVNNIENGLYDLNRIEGYFTMVLNEIYFYSGLSKEEALARILTVMKNKEPNNADEFYDGWLELYPGDGAYVQGIKDGVTHRLIDKRKEILEERQEVISNFLDDMWPAPPEGQGTPCDTGHVAEGTNCSPEPGDFPGPFYSPDPLAFVPGGLAVCRGGEQFFITDNSGGRILLIHPGEGEHQSVTMLRGLEHPGDIDMSDNGGAVVYSSGGNVQKRFLGLTAYIEDGDGAPLSGAGVKAMIDTLEMAASTDADGYVTIFNLLSPERMSGNVRLFVTHSGNTKEYSYSIKPCQTFVEITFDPSLKEEEKVTPDPRVPKRKDVTVRREREGDPPPPPPPVNEDEPPPPPPPPPFPQPEDGPPPIPGSCSPPKVALVTPVDGMVTNIGEQIIRGTVSDLAIREAAIIVNGQEIAVDVFNGQYAAAVTLPEGENVISVRAQSICTPEGGTTPETYTGSSDAVHVTYDPSAADTGAVYGYVVDEFTGVPVADAAVTAEGTGRETVSKSDGYYSFGALPAGDDVLITAAP